MSIEVNALSFSYGAHRVLNELSFSLPDGALVAVLGANGAGKTTLFRCILNLLPSYSGQILLNGENSKLLSRRQLAALAAYVPQSAGQTFSFSVLQTVLMGTTGKLPLLQTPGSAEEERARHALAQLGMEAFADRPVDQLSGGERQLVLLARALAQEARLLIMDEPTANLDYGNRLRVLTKTAALCKQNYTILYSTHDPDQALRYASHVLALQQGSVAACGRTDEVLTEALIERLYGFPVQILELETGAGRVKSCVPLR